MTPSRFTKPRTGDAQLTVRFRNGWIVGPYTAQQLRWSDKDEPGDVVAVERVKGGKV